MQIEVLKSKIHTATVTEANVDYRGSITISKELMKAANLYPYEKVDVNNTSNGNRITTYVIEGKKGEVCINGAAARLFNEGDIVHILSYATMKISKVKGHIPIVVYTDNNIPI